MSEPLTEVFAYANTPQGCGGCGVQARYRCEDGTIVEDRHLTTTPEFRAIIFRIDGWALDLCAACARELREQLEQIEAEVLV